MSSKQSMKDAAAAAARPDCSDELPLFTFLIFCIFSSFTLLQSNTEAFHEAKIRNVENITAVNRTVQDFKTLIKKKCCYYLLETLDSAWLGGAWHTLSLQWRCPIHLSEAHQDIMLLKGTFDHNALCILCLVVALQTEGGLGNTVLHLTQISYQWRLAHCY